MASDALVIRFMTTWRICVASAITLGRSAAKVWVNVAFLLVDTDSSCPISDTSAFKEIGWMTKRPLPE